MIGNNGFIFLLSLFTFFGLYLQGYLALVFFNLFSSDLEIFLYLALASLLWVFVLFPSFLLLCPSGVSHDRCLPGTMPPAVAAALWVRISRSLTTPWGSCSRVAPEPCHEAQRLYVATNRSRSDATSKGRNWPYYERSKKATSKGLLASRLERSDRTHVGMSFWVKDNMLQFLESLGPSVRPQVAKNSGSWGPTSWSRNQVARFGKHCMFWHVLGQECGSM